MHYLLAYLQVTAKDNIAVTGQRIHYLLAYLQVTGKNNIAVTGQRVHYLLAYLQVTAKDNIPVTGASYALLTSLPAGDSKEQHCCHRQRMHYY